MSSVPPGLQPERTTLSWERTAAALIANGVLLLLRHHHSIGLARAALSATAFGLAVVIAFLGRPGAQRPATREIQTIAIVLPFFSALSLLVLYLE